MSSKQLKNNFIKQETQGDKTKTRKLHSSFASGKKIKNDLDKEEKNLLYIRKKPKLEENGEKVDLEQDSDSFDDYSNESDDYSSSESDDNKNSKTSDDYVDEKRVFVTSIPLEATKEQFYRFALSFGNVVFDLLFLYLYIILILFIFLLFF